MKSLFVLLLLMPGVAVACPKGSYEYNGGCEYDIQPEIAVPVKPSSEKPPSDKLPSYQRSGVIVMDVPNMADADAKADQEKAQATADGRRAAGLTDR